MPKKKTADWWKFDRHEVLAVTAKMPAKMRTEVKAERLARKVEIFMVVGVIMPGANTLFGFGSWSGSRRYDVPERQFDREDILEHLVSKIEKAVTSCPEARDAELESLRYWRSLAYASPASPWVYRFAVSQRWWTKVDRDRSRFQDLLAVLLDQVDRVFDFVSVEAELIRAADLPLER